MMDLRLLTHRVWAAAWRNGNREEMNSQDWDHKGLRGVCWWEIEGRRGGIKA